MIRMIGTFNRTKPSAIVRDISSDYDKALSSYFGSSTPDVGAARGAHSHILLLSAPTEPKLRFSRSCPAILIVALSRMLL